MRAHVTKGRGGSCRGAPRSGDQAENRLVAGSSRRRRGEGDSREEAARIGAADGSAQACGPAAPSAPAPARPAAVSAAARRGVPPASCGHCRSGAPRRSLQRRSPRPERSFRSRARRLTWWSFHRRQRPAVAAPLRRPRPLPPSLRWVRWWSSPRSRRRPLQRRRARPPTGVPLRRHPRWPQSLPRLRRPSPAAASAVASPAAPPPISAGAAAAPAPKEESPLAAAAAAATEAPAAPRPAAPPPRRVIMPQTGPRPVYSAPPPGAGSRGRAPGGIQRGRPIFDRRPQAVPAVQADRVLRMGAPGQAPGARRPMHPTRSQPGGPRRTRRSSGHGRASGLWRPSWIWPASRHGRRAGPSASG